MTFEFDDSQMNAMLRDDADFAEFFIKEIVPKHLFEFADIATDTPQTREMVIWCRRYAEHFGFDDPIHHIHFAVLMWKMGPNFFEFEPYKEILADNKLSDEEKIERCNLQPSFEQDDDAIRNQDERYWNPQFLKGNILGVPVEDLDNGWGQ